MSATKQSPATRRRKHERKFESDDDRVVVARQICETYSEGRYTIDSCCKTHGVSPRSFLNWCGRIADVADLYKKAKTAAAFAFKETLREKALSSLERLIEGFHVEEKSTEEDSNGAGKAKVKTIRKYYPPNPVAVLFALKNTDPENFKDRHETQLTGPNSGPICVETGFDPAKLSADELATFRTLLEKARSKED